MDTLTQPPEVRHLKSKYGSLLGLLRVWGGAEGNEEERRNEEKGPAVTPVPAEEKSTDSVPAPTKPRDLDDLSDISSLTEPTEKATGKSLEEAMARMQEVNDHFLLCKELAINGDKVLFVTLNVAQQNSVDMYGDVFSPKLRSQRNLDVFTKNARGTEIEEAIKLLVTKKEGEEVTLVRKLWTSFQKEVKDKEDKNFSEEWREWVLEGLRGEGVGEVAVEDLKLRWKPAAVKKNDRKLKVGFYLENKEEYQNRVRRCLEVFREYTSSSPKVVFCLQEVNPISAFLTVFNSVAGDFKVVDDTRSLRDDETVCLTTYRGFDENPTKVVYGTGEGERVWPDLMHLAFSQKISTKKNTKCEFQNFHVYNIHADYSLVNSYVEGATIGSWLDHALDWFLSSPKPKLLVGDFNTKHTDLGKKFSKVYAQTPEAHFGGNGTFDMIAWWSANEEITDVADSGFDLYKYDDLLPRR